MTGGLAPDPPGLRRRAVAGLALGLLLGASACGILAPGDDGAEDDLARARALWASAGVEDYDLRLDRACFCLRLGVVVVEVRDGVRGATFVATGEGAGPVAASDLEYYPTVEGLFQLVEEAIDGRADEVRVTYHPVLGYPVDLWVDRSRSIADEEFGYQAELVAPSSGG